MGRQDLFTKRLMENFFKVKCTLLQALRLRKGRTDHRGSRGIALPFLDHGTRSGWGVSVTPRPLFIPGKNPVPIVQEAGWAPGPVWTGAENLAPTGIRSPDRSARSQSLYRLSYPAHFGKIQEKKKILAKFQYRFLCPAVLVLSNPNTHETRPFLWVCSNA